jgi:hypothetical protein
MFAQILILMCGAPVAICGGTVHLILLAYPRFRLASLAGQTLSVSLAAAPLLAVAVYIVFKTDQPFHVDLKSLGVFLGFYLMPTVVFAALITWLVRRFVRR